MKKGMYIRSKDKNGVQYIRKIVELPEDTRYGSIVVDKDIHNVFWVSKKNVLKASFNLIDLIKEGDYVNGQQVKQIEKGDGYYYLFNACYDGITSHIIAGKDVDGYTKPIENIVTKEEFEARKYVVERDK